MPSSRNYLIGACIFSVLAGTAPINAAPQGFLEGHLKILSGRPVELTDENSGTATTKTQGDYSQHPLIILSRAERKQITRVVADKDGNYRVALPPGDYILDVEERAKKRLRVSAQPFTVVPNETVHVDLTILAGFANE
jgi:hypothetical protein